MPELGIWTKISSHENHYGRESIGGLIEYAKEQGYTKLMIDNALKSQGVGKEVYALLEEYFIKQNAQRIRIDVVYNYPNNVLEFWEKMRFIKQEEIELEWNKLKLKAYLMNKVLEI